MRRNSEKIYMMVILAVFTALAFAATCVFHIKVSFLTFDIKDSLIAVCGMIFGPIAALVVAVATALIEMVTISETAYYGLIMNILATTSFACTASGIYKVKRNMYGAVLGLVAGVLSMTAVMMLANLLITPFYMGVERNVVAGLIPKLLLPFNFTKAVLNASLTLIIYKPLITALRRAGAVRPSGESKGYAFGRRSIVVTLTSVAIAVASIVVMLVVLGGKISFFR